MLIVRYKVAMIGKVKRYSFFLNCYSISIIVKKQKTPMNDIGVWNLKDYWLNFQCLPEDKP